MKRSVKAQRWTFSHHLLIFIWIIEFSLLLSHAIAICYMCAYFFRIQEIIVIYFSISTYSIAGYGRVLVCYQLVNKPHDRINVLQDIWEDNVTIINFFYNFIAWEVLMSYTLCICIYHNHYRIPFVHRFILYSTKLLLFFYIFSFSVVYIKLLILPPQAFFFLGFWFLLCCYVLCIWKEAC